MSINELWSVLSHGALEQFDPNAKAEELEDKDYDSILESAVLVDDYTLQVQHATQGFVFTAAISQIVTIHDYAHLCCDCKSERVNSSFCLFSLSLFARSPLMRRALNMDRRHCRALFLSLD